VPATFDLDRDTDDVKLATAGIFGNRIDVEIGPLSFGFPLATPDLHFPVHDDAFSLDVVAQIPSDVVGERVLILRPEYTTRYLVPEVWGGRHLPLQFSGEPPKRLQHHLQELLAALHEPRFPHADDPV